MTFAGRVRRPTIEIKYMDWKERVWILLFFLPNGFTECNFKVYLQQRSFFPITQLLVIIKF